MDRYVGAFLLAAPVDGHPVGTLVQVSVPVPDRSRLMLEFCDRHQVRTDACVLLCGSVGSLRLRELGYAGPLIRRPLLEA